MPHHLGQDNEQSGAYIREGKSYKRLWVHAIHEGTKTRFWTSDGSSATQLGATRGFVHFYPGEEFAFTQNYFSTGAEEITRSLTNPLTPQSSYSVGSPWDDQDDSRSVFRGAHILRLDKRLTGRGLAIQFHVQYCTERVHFLGWGAEYGPGPANMYYNDPEYPYPV